MLPLLLLQYAGVCDCKMEQGSLRCDVNVSIMKSEDKEFGTRTECKNLNSLKSIGRAIDYEIKRQSMRLDLGYKVIQETRRFNDNKGETTSMRSKEDAHDYRYFPEPDILQINFTDEMLDEIKGKLPELPHKRLARYVNEYGLSEVDAKIIVNSKKVSDFFNDAVSAYNNPKSVSNFIIVELLRRVNLGEVSMESLPFTAQDFAKLVEMADTEKVSKNDAKKILRLMIETGKDCETVAKENGMLIVNDMGKVNEVLDKVFADNAATVEQYANGETKVFGFLMGQCTKSLRGVCTPKVIKEELEKKLASLTVKNSTEEVHEKEVVHEESLDELTSYSNPNSYKPSVKNNIKQIGTSQLKKEFELEDALNNIGKDITLSCCVHKIRTMGAFSSISRRLIEDEKYRERVVSYLKQIDVGINDLVVTDDKDFNPESGDVEEHKVVKSVHAMFTTDGNLVGSTEFGLFKESSGTLRFLAYIQRIIEIQESGGIFIVDELSDKLHPLLTKFIIDIFQSEENQSAQLVFSTHDVFQLTKEQFRRDEVVFVDKNEKGESTTFSLAQLKVREDSSFSKDYYLQNENIKRLDYVLGTHPHSNHMGGMSRIVENVEIGEFIMPHLPDKDVPTTRYFENLLIALDNADLDITEAANVNLYKSFSKYTYIFISVLFTVYPVY